MAAADIEVAVLPLLGIGIWLGLLGRGLAIWFSPSRAAEGFLVGRTF